MGIGARIYQSVEVDGADVVAISNAQRRSRLDVKWMAVYSN